MRSLSAFILYQICSYRSFCMYFPSSPVNCQTRISYRRYRCINMGLFYFRSDLKEMSFVKCSANSVSWHYNQYVHDLSHMLDSHALLLSNLKTKQHADSGADPAFK